MEFACIRLIGATSSLTSAAHPASNEGIGSNKTVSCGETDCVIARLTGMAAGAVGAVKMTARQEPASGATCPEPGD